MYVKSCPLESNKSFSRPAIFLLNKIVSTCTNESFHVEKYRHHVYTYARILKPQQESFVLKLNYSNMQHYNRSIFYVTDRLRFKNLTGDIIRDKQ